MRVSKIIGELTRELKRDYHVVGNPQDPYLYAAPDLLIADYDLLVGVFILKVLERRLPEQLVIRLAASRVALPIQLRCVLLLAETSLPRGLLGKVSSSFDAVVPEFDIPRLKSILADRNFEHSVPSVSLEMRQRAYWRAEAYYAESVKQLDTPRKVEDPYMILEQLRTGGDYNEVQIPRWLEPRRTTGVRGATYVLKGTDLYVAAVNLTKSELYLRELKPYCEAGIALDYEMANNGKIESNRYFDVPKILLVNKRPEGKVDRDKPVRAAAFAGWTLMTAETTTEVERCAGILSRRLEGV